MRTYKYYFMSNLLSVYATKDHAQALEHINTLAKEYNTQHQGEHQITPDDITITLIRE